MWAYVKGRPAEVTRSIFIPPARIFDGGSMPKQFEPRKHYFAVVINEMFLTKARQWWSEYDPMALVVSEFTYNGERKTVPFIVGPSMIQASMQNVPNGMTITDTLVAGIHPYSGGKFALTVILAQVKRHSYAKRILGLIENVAHAFPVGPALEPHLKVASAVMDGVEALFGMDDTKPITGHRWEYNDGISPWLQPGFFALIDADEKDVGADRLSVVGGRLRDGNGRDALGFRRADFLLYSLQVIERRNDFGELAFYDLFKKALIAAASNEEGSWERAKAGLVTLYQEMLMSPDLTWEQVQQLSEEFKTQLLAAHKTAVSFTLGERQQRAAPEDSTFTGEENTRRQSKLREIHSLLKL